ncbi:hypothetical protein OGAPHI_002455 [Ogataea philodendri]|uniref:PRP1 splicing factor N-terminal domain-containing protein n=1 Tax=Ogataea philodendri TaxID=1378263 RepID=A0A9P8T7B9_9ASCO|nr:uncharacterized protein OGAPHI_002455 [Ogataea philodendri]KAH3668701.1 hypothetical protein OGAPHI_002455 [Ogataea philodendri]
MERRSFLDQEPPPGYIAGLGRGATGFTTQADLGTVRRLPAGSFASDDDKDDGDQDRFLDADQDEAGVFGGLRDDDDDADQIYDAIEQKLQQKKARAAKRARSAVVDSDGRVQAQDISIGQSIQTIGEEFKDYKQQLAEVSTDEWLNLPESGDFTKRNKRARKELQERQRFYRNSDLVSVSGPAGTANVTNEDDDVDLTGVSVAKEKVLAGQLMNVQEQSAVVSVDADEYLASLAQSGDRIATEIGDYAKTRALFAKMREANPRRPDTWIASARLEFEAKRFRRARELIQEGCERCPKSEEAWLVNIEMNKQDVGVCKVIVAQAVRFNARSLRLWLCAASLETDSVSKKRIVKKALEFLPACAELWLEVVKYEPDTAMAVRMLQKAVELVPESVSLWLKYAELGKTRQVLEQALTKVAPGDAHVIWVELAKFEEIHTENEVKVTRLVERCFASTALDREKWLGIALECEQKNLPLVARAIVFNSMSLGVPETDKLEFWRADALERSPELAKSMFMYITANYPDDTASWMDFIRLEKQLKDYEQLYVVYEMATRAIPTNKLFYLMYAKDKWKLDGDVQKARDVINEGLEAIPDCEDLWFALIRLQDTNEARNTYAKCRARLGKLSARVWYKSVTFERQSNDPVAAKKLAETGLALFPKEQKLHLQLGQIMEEQNELAEAAEAYYKGTFACVQADLLWVHLARVHEKQGNLIKARSVLDQALIASPDSDLVYLERVLLEERANNRSQAERILAAALKRLGTSAVLWRQNILFAKKTHRKNLYGAALNATNDSPVVILAIARDMWVSGKIAKAKQFFDACYDQDPGYGDYYMEYYAFLRKHGTKAEIAELERRFVEHDPHSGERWCAVMKDVRATKTGVDLLRDAVVGREGV